MPSSPVGATRIEVVGDLSTFAATTIEEAGKAGQKAAASFGAKFDAAMATEMAAAGRTSGEVFYKGVDGKLRDANGKFVARGRAAAAGYTEAMVAGMEAGSPAVGRAAATQGRAAERASAASGAKAGESWASKFRTALIGKSLLPAALFVGIGVAAIKMAGDFETGMTRLVTAAGESKAAMGTVGAGVLSVARDTGTGTKDLLSGMYMIESAGFHGRDAVNVMRAAAQGAKVDMADVHVVANALTTAMTDMHAPTSQAATVMSQLVATVGHGKMTMDELAGSLHSVLPNAAALHIGMGQVGGAIATMTGQGISAMQATQNLNHAILSLANPNAVATKAMAAFGITATDVTANLGDTKRGLAGTIGMLSQTILNHMGPAGLTLEKTLNTSAIAADKEHRMFQTLSSSGQALAKQYEAGGMSVFAYNKALKALGPTNEVLGKQWRTGWVAAHGFNALLRSGSPDAMTYAGALAKMTGGSVGLQVALHLTGENMKTYRADIAAVNAAHAEGGNNVEGWAIKQATFNQRMSQLKETVLTAAITIGRDLLPAVSAFAGFLLNDLIPGISSLAHFLNDNRTAILAVAGVIGAVLLPQLIGMGVAAVTSAAETAVLWTMYKVDAVQAAASAVASSWAIVAGYVRMGVAAAASMGETIALWVMYGAESLAQAARVAAAWIISMGPIALVIAAVVGIVYLIIRNWGTIRRVTEEVFGAVSRFVVRIWNDIYTFTARILTDVLRFITRTWTSAYNFTARILTDVWTFITGIWNTIFRTVSGILTSITDYVARHWRLLVTIATLGAALLWIVVMDHWHQIVGVFTRLYNDVAGWVTRLWRDITNTWNRIYGDVAAVVARLWRDVSGFVARLARDVTGFVTRLWRDVTGFFTRIWHDVAGFVARMARDVAGFVTRMWHDVTGVIARLWHDIVGFFTRIYNDVAKWVNQIWQNEVRNWTRIWNDVTAVVTRLWRSVVDFFTRIWRDVTGFASRIWRDVSDYFTRLWRSVTDLASRIWHGVTGFFNNLWHDATRVFSGIVADIEHYWGRLKSIIEAPIRFVVNTIYDQGILPVWNAIAGVLHEGGLSPIHLATGGPVTGPASAGDNIPIFATAGEGVVNLSGMQKIGGEAGLAAINGSSGSGGPGDHFLFGGIVHAVGNLFRGAMGGLVKPAVHTFESAADGILNPMGGAGQLLDRGVHRIGDAIIRWVSGDDKANAVPAYNASGGAAQWADLVRRVLAELHSPSSFQAVMNRIAFESGGNPNAINLTDPNAAAGHPSQGLLQTIPSTFAAWAGPYVGRGITDPLANIYAGINYADHTYGSMPDPAVTGLGYDNGGLLMPGKTLVENKTGKPESVFTHGQMGDLIAALNAPMRLVDLNGHYVATIVNTANARNGRRS